MTRLKSKEIFPLKDAMAVAVAVDRVHGFIKAGNQALDYDTNRLTVSNKTIVIDTLRQMASPNEVKLVNGVPVQICLPTENDYTNAGSIFTYFDKNVSKSKLADNLEYYPGINGSPNSFYFNLDIIFTNNAVHASSDVGLIAGLPHSRRIGRKRAMMAEFNTANTANGYIGGMQRRTDVTGKVMDIKAVQKTRHVLVTVFTSENKIAKFFFPDSKATTLPPVGKEIDFCGTVKKQDVNDHTGCQETTFGRVAIK
jgi:hypothetical protein